MLKGKHIVLGISGSIAAYKAADLASKLTQAGAIVDVVMTREAEKFVSALTFSSLTHRTVHRELFDPDSETSVEHVALANRADVVVVAPATANIMAKMAHGLTDDLLTCTLLATAAPVIVAPAMDGHMWDSPATQENVKTLQRRGVLFIGPDRGYLASGLSGVGRLSETARLLGTISQVLGKRDGGLRSRHVVITSGGTQEPIDPVRVITNRSSGKMGYAIAEAARDRGAKVTLVTAPTALPDPVGVDIVRVETARQMRDAVAKVVKGASALIMAAAVADYTPASPAKSKIKKKDAAYVVDLKPTADILATVQGGQVRVGFAAETENLIANAKAKLQKKRLDLIVANDVSARDAGFSSDNNRVVIIDSQGKQEPVALMPKYEVAQRILDRVAAILERRKK